MNLNKLMKQAQKMQEQMAKTQAELEDKTVEVQAAGGKVTVVANGSGDVISIKIAKEIVDPEDVEFLEAAVLSGVTQAIARRQRARAIGDDEDYRRAGCDGAGVVDALRGSRVHPEPRRRRGISQSKWRRRAAEPIARSMSPRIHFPLRGPSPSARLGMTTDPQPASFAIYASRNANFANPSSSIFSASRS